MRGEFIEVGGDRLYYYAAGSRGRGDPMVLIHGFPTTSHVWGSLVSLLPAGHRIVVPDLLGFGRSDHGVAADFGVAAHSARIIGALDVLGIRKACLVGHQLGAVIAATIAVSAPERVAALALLHPLGGDVTVTGTFAVLRAFLPLVRVAPPALFRRAIRSELASWFADPQRARPSIDLYVAGLTRAPRWQALLRQLGALDPRQMTAFTRSLAGVRCPVAIVAAHHDPAVPRVALDRIRDALPNATLDMIPQARHFSPEESPEQVASIIERLLAR